MKAYTREMHAKMVEALGPKPSPEEMEVTFTSELLEDTQHNTETFELNPEQSPDRLFILQDDGTFEPDVW
jgi:hypothetical protein